MAHGCLRTRRSLSFDRKHDFSVFVWHRGRIDDGAPVFPGSLLRNCSRNKHGNSNHHARHEGGALGASCDLWFDDGGRHLAGKQIKWLFLHMYVRSFVTFEMPVLLVGLFYFLWDFTLAMFDDFAMSTPLLHSAGAICGIVLGFTAYFLNWFQLDGEDAISRFRDILGNQPTSKPSDLPKTPTKPKARRLKFGTLDQQTKLLKKYLRQRRFHLAKMKLNQIETEHPKFLLTERHLVAFINLASQHQDGPNLLGWMDEYLTRFEQHATKIRFNKARVQAALTTKKTAGLVPAA